MNDNISIESVIIVSIFPGGINQLAHEAVEVVKYAAHGTKVYAKFNDIFIRVMPQMSAEDVERSYYSQKS